MTRQEWFNRANKNSELIISLLRAYHPKNRNSKTSPGDRITARATENYSIGVRENIKQKTKTNPIEDFQNALKENDHRTLDRIMNEAWFGVPESTNCWNIPGFKEMVDLLEDPIEEEEAENAKG